jgi:predicted ribosome-associated RNA-binding protein Tma20
MPTSSQGDIVAVMTLKEEAVLVGEARLSSEQMLGDKGVAVKTQQVFMLPGTYPRDL